VQQKASECSQKEENFCKVATCPLIGDCKDVVHCNNVKNCQVTCEDITIWLKTYGENVNVLKEKSTRGQPRVVVNDHIEIPKDFIEAHKDVILFVDISTSTSVH